MQSEEMTKGRKPKNLVAIQALTELSPRELADLIDTFLALATNYAGSLCISSDRLEGILREILERSGKKQLMKQLYKIRADLIRLGVLIPALYDGISLTEMKLLIWCIPEELKKLKERLKKKGRVEEYVCVHSDDYAKLRQVATDLRKEDKMLSLLKYVYQIRRNQAFVKWIDELYAYTRISVVDAYKLLQDIVLSEIGENAKQYLKKLMPTNIDRMKQVLVKPLIKLSDNIISLINDTIAIDTIRYYNVFRQHSAIVKRAENKVITNKITVTRLVEAYVEYLKVRGWIKDWLKWGGHSISLYELWRYHFGDIPWEKFLSRVKELASTVLGIEYTYYFIYQDEKAHSINVSVEVARNVLGQRFYKLITQ